MSFWGYTPYVRVDERRKKAEKAAAKAKKAGAKLWPVEASRGTIVKTVWGKAWCDNLEQYSDFENRLPRGRTYVRNGSVIDLQVEAGEVKAQVMGSSLYKVRIKLKAVPGPRWKAICADCTASIDSLVDLLQGKLAKPVMARICIPKTGLFPAPEDITFDCDCPDWAGMCKHIAAVLYGIGARLDRQPELLFSLRQVDAKDLVARAVDGLPKTGKGPATGRVLNDSDLAEVFGLDMAEPVETPAVKQKLKPAPKPIGKSTAKQVKRMPQPVSAKPVTTKTLAVVKVIKTPLEAPEKTSTKAAPATLRKVASKSKSKR